MDKFSLMILCVSVSETQSSDVRFLFNRKNSWKIKKIGKLFREATKKNQRNLKGKFLLAGDVHLTGSKFDFEN